MDPSPKPADGELVEQVREAFPQLNQIELIGIGGMGRVYRACQPSLDRSVALKVLPGDKADHPEWVERFTREARALARLNHPNVVRVLDFGTAQIGGNSQPYLIMEFIDGVNLRQAMELGKLSAREALMIVPKLCDALHYAHEHGVLHRDIKPENVLIDTEGRVMLVDFGLAKLRDETQMAFTLTQSGAKLGTIAYMAPEQIESPGDVDHRADIYSLGVVFYEMLTGELPLGVFPAPSQVSGGDPQLDEVVLRTLEKKREKRFADAGELKSGIERASTKAAPARRTPHWDRTGYEFKSKANIGGWPLLHVSFNRDSATGKVMRARGIIAIGVHAQGVVALGLISYGVFAWGLLSIGLAAMGVVALGGIASGVVGLGLLAAQGVCAVAPVALGVAACGYIAAGVRAFGWHAASVNGIVDPVAGDIADRWMFGVVRGSQVLNSALVTILMVVAAYGAWRVGRRYQIMALFLGLSLIGPLTFFTSNGLDSQNHKFGDRVVEQEKAKLTETKRMEAEARRQRTSQIGALSQDWTVRVSRTDSPSVREGALQAILSAIRSGADDELEAGLLAVARLSEVTVDKTPFRDPIRTHLTASNTGIQGLAISALLATNYEAADADRILAMVPDCDDRLLSVLGFAIATLSNRDYTGRFSALMLSVLERGMAIANTRDEEGNLYDSRATLNPLWGGKFSPEIEARVIQWSFLDAGEDGLIHASNSSRGYNAFYYALSTQANKSAASVKRLLELAQHPDTTNIAGRCLWGMQGSVPDAKDQSEVATFVIQLLGDRNGDYQWEQGLLLLRQYATSQHVASLVVLAGREALPSERKSALNGIISVLKNKP